MRYLQGLVTGRRDRIQGRGGKWNLKNENIMWENVFFLQLYANTHAFSQLVLVPWGYTMEEYKYHDRVMEVVGPVG